jgi:hypothetical protein
MEPPRETACFAHLRGLEAREVAVVVEKSKRDFFDPAGGLRYPLTTIL